MNNAIHKEHMTFKYKKNQNPQKCTYTSLMLHNVQPSRWWSLGQHSKKMQRLVRYTCLWIWWMISVWIDRRHPLHLQSCLLTKKAVTVLPKTQKLAKKHIAKRPELPNVIKWWSGTTSFCICNLKKELYAFWIKIRDLETQNEHEKLHGVRAKRRTSYRLSKWEDQQFKTRDTTSSNWE